MYNQSAIYGFQSNNKGYNNFRQIQQQQFKQQDNQVEIQELRYEVYQDLQNIINLFYSLIGVIEYFKNDPNHPMITTATNKLICQLGLSNSIHYEQQNSSQGNDIYKSNSKRLNEKALQIFNDIITNQNLPRGLSQYIEFFKSNLSSHMHLQSIPLKSTITHPEFNSQTLQKVIDAMNSTDTIYKNIRKGERVPSPNKNSIQQTAEEYKRHTLQRLQVNFPQIQNNNNAYSTPSKIQYQNHQSPNPIPYERTINRGQIMQQTSQQYQQPQQSNRNQFQQPSQIFQSQYPKSSSILTKSNFYKNGSQPRQLPQQSEPQQYSPQQEVLSFKSYPYQQNPQKKYDFVGAAQSIIYQQQQKKNYYGK